MRQRVSTLAAEERVIENSLRAYHNGDGTFSVRSVSRSGLRWRVRVEAVIVRGVRYLRARCECESGTNRPADLVPCMHSAAVLRRLEREGLARWDGGVWVASERLAS